MPPEPLEPRNAPGAFLILSWLLDEPTSDISEVSSVEPATEAASGRSKSVKETRRLASSGDDHAVRMRAGAVDQADLLSRFAEKDGVLSGGRTVSKPAPTSPLPAAASLPLVPTMLSMADRVSSAILPAITEPQSTKEDRADEPAILVDPPPSASRGAAVDNSGGGGNSNGGGPPASGGGGAVPTLPPQATTANTPPPTVAATPALDALPNVIPTPSSSPLPPATATPPVAEPAPQFVQAEINTPTTTTVALSPAVSTGQDVSLPFVAANGPQIMADEVQALLDRATAATARNDAIIAVVDRSGRILGVRVEEGVPIDPASDTMVFAIDGAVAKARTAAFFSNDAAPLTSRTVRFISQSTITQREVESNPNAPDPTVQGPGFVAPIGLGGRFPPDVMFTPHIDLFAIEHTNRDSLIHPGPDGVRDTGDDIMLGKRFGADFVHDIDIPAPESYGFVSGLMPDAQSRGIATLPGGVPLFKFDRTDPAKPTLRLVGGIGVFFPGPDGFATFEQDFQHRDDRVAAGQQPQTTGDRLNAPLVLEAEYTAFAAAGGVGTISGIPLPDGYFLPRGRIDLAGIKLEIYGPHPTGEKGLLAFGKKLSEGTAGGIEMPVTPDKDLNYLDGQGVPSGWLVAPRGSGDLTAEDVRKIIEDGVSEAERVRAAIRLPLGSRTSMVLAVTDTNGDILGLYRMPDATFFSIDVAVAKARNVAYYADGGALQPADQFDENGDGQPDIPLGTALTNRTFRYLASPFFPSGSTGPSGPFSILNDPGINPRTAENLGPPLPADVYTSVLGHDAFNPGTNFRELDDPNAIPGNQNGVVFFPGSTPLYKNGVLIGGFGVSGDGVDQDDVVTFAGAGQFLPRPNSNVVRADEVFVRDVRLPFQKFSRNARG